MVMEKRTMSERMLARSQGHTVWPLAAQSQPVWTAPNTTPHAAPEAPVTTIKYEMA
jgi:hypothetical protein